MTRGDHRWWDLVRIDPVTLAQVTNTPYLKGAGGSPIASADGRSFITLSRVQHRTEPDQVTMHLYSTNGFAEVSHPVGIPATDARLSPDGTRAVMFDPASGGLSWEVVETASGREVGRGQTTDPGPCCAAGDYWIDRSASRVYRLVTPGTGAESGGPVKPVLVANDATTGRELGRLTIDSPLAGIWRTAQARQSNDPMMQVLMPGFALSRDGQNLAVYAADSPVLTLVDLARMKVTGTWRLAPQASLWERLGLVQTANAKGLNGFEWQAAFTADSARLVAWGQRYESPASDVFRSIPVGAVVIDLSSLTIRSVDVPGIWPANLVPAPDGSAVYLFGTRAPADGSLTGPPQPRVLARLDLHTLSITAERQFDGVTGSLILARPQA